MEYNGQLFLQKRFQSQLFYNYDSKFSKHVYLVNLLSQKENQNEFVIEGVMLDKWNLRLKSSKVRLSIFSFIGYISQENKNLFSSWSEVLYNL